MWRQLDGVLSDTPFLATKRSTSRTETALLYCGATESSAVIWDFAQDCMRDIGNRRVSKLPPESLDEISMNPGLIDETMEQRGLQRVSQAVVAVRGKQLATRDQAEDRDGARRG